MTDSNTAPVVPPTGPAALPDTKEPAGVHVILKADTKDALPADTVTFTYKVRKQPPEDSDDDDLFAPDSSFHIHSVTVPSHDAVLNRLMPAISQQLTEWKATCTGNKSNRCIVIFRGSDKPPYITARINVKVSPPRKELHVTIPDSWYTWDSFCREAEKFRASLIRQLSIHSVVSPLMGENRLNMFWVYWTPLDLNSLDYPQSRHDAGSLSTVKTEVIPPPAVVTDPPASLRRSKMQRECADGLTSVVTKCQEHLAMLKVHETKLAQFHEQRQKELKDTQTTDAELMQRLVRGTQETVARIHQMLLQINKPGASIVPASIVSK